MHLARGSSYMTHGSSCMAHMLKV